jgi:ABC-type bacteriocin/lantibiotic exporter with double-glycine peptidase domain
MSQVELSPSPPPRPQVRPITEAGRADTPLVRAPGLLAYIRQMSWRQQIVICVLACIVAALETVPLEFQRRIVNEAIDRRDLHLLTVLGAGFLAATLIQSALKYTLRVYGGAVSEDVILHARRRLFNIAVWPLRHAGRNRETQTPQPRTGRAVSVIGPEMDDVGSFVGESLAEPLVQFGTFVGLLGYMLVVDPLLAVVSLALFAPQILLLPWVQRQINRLTRLRVNLSRAMGDAVAEAIETAETEGPARSARFGAVEATFQNRLVEIRDTRVRLFRWQYAGKVLVNLFSHLGPLTVLMFGGYLVIEGRTTLGIVVAFVSGFERLAEPARELSAFYQLVSMTRVEFRTIGEWVDAHDPPPR